MLLGSCFDGNNGLLNITLPISVVSPDAGQVTAARQLTGMRFLQTTTAPTSYNVTDKLSKVQAYKTNLLSEVSKLAGFVMNHLGYASEDFMTVDSYIIDRLLFNMFNNTQSDWVKESVKTLSEIFQKPNVIQSNTNYTACHYYLDLIDQFINKTMTAYNLEVESAS